MMLPAAIFHLPFPFFAAVGDNCTISGSGFFFFPTWWEYLPTKIDSLSVCSPAFNPPGDIWLVGLAVLDMLLRVAGFVAVISIMVAGVSHIFSGGNPEKAAAARKRLYNSLIGLALVLIATGVVTFIGRTIGG